MRSIPSAILQSKNLWSWFLHLLQQRIGMVPQTLSLLSMYNSNCLPPAVLSMSRDSRRAQQPMTYFFIHDGLYDINGFRFFPHRRRSANEDLHVIFQFTWCCVGVTTNRYLRVCRLQPQTLGQHQVYCMDKTLQPRSLQGRGVSLWSISKYRYG